MSKRNRRGPHNRELATAGPPLTAKPKALATSPAPKPKAAISPELAEAAKTAFARKLAMGGFAVCFTVMGLLAGLNHWLETPATITGNYALGVWVGAALGDLQLDWVRAVMTGLLGLLVGVTLGATVGLRTPKMLASWVLGGLAMAIGLATTHNPIGGAAGWLLGLGLASKTPVA